MILVIITNNCILILVHIILHMAKKKTTAAHQLLHTPISLPMLGIFALIGTSLLSINLSLFLSQPTQTATIPATITQNVLQDVLGTSISIGERPQQKEILKNDPINKYWQEVINEKPDYRDAYIALAVISFNNKDCPNTKFYLDKAYDLDPDNLGIHELAPLLASCLQEKK